MRGGGARVRSAADGTLRGGQTTAAVQEVAHDVARLGVKQTARAAVFIGAEVSAAIGLAHSEQ